MTSKQVLGVSTVESLRDLSPLDFPGRKMTPAEFRHIAELCDALWLHDGDPSKPHAELTSGKCSNGFVDTLRVLCHANLCDILGMQLVRVFEEYWHFKPHPSVRWVVGSDHAGATLSYSVARWMGTKHDFTEKGPDKTQIWKRFTIGPDEHVLQVEELVTTTGTLQAVRDGIRAANPHPVTFVPVVMTLIHRSQVREIEGSPILYFVHYDIETWEPSECPLCKAGSKRLRPKQNWAELTGK